MARFQTALPALKNGYFSRTTLPAAKAWHATRDCARRLQKKESACGYPLWQRADGRCGGDRAPGPAGPLDRHQHDRTLPRRFVVLPASSSDSRPRFNAGRPCRGHPRRYLPQPPEHGRPRRTLHADLQHRQHRATAGRARDCAGHPRHRQWPGDLSPVPRLAVADRAQHL